MGGDDLVPTVWRGRNDFDDPIGRPDLLAKLAGKRRLPRLKVADGVVVVAETGQRSLDGVR
jgi:hypothetical protein